MNVFYNMGIKMTYLEVEFYNNKEAMDIVTKNYGKIAGEMAMVLREHLAVTTPITSNSVLVDDSSSDGTGVMITGTCQTDASKMVAYLKKNNPSLSDEYINDLVNHYIKEGEAEGIRGDIAFAQACCETHFWKFDLGTAVTIDQNNFAGIGVTQKGMKGNSFPSVQTGVRAQIQHLKA